MLAYVTPQLTEMSGNEEGRESGSGTRAGTEESAETEHVSAAQDVPNESTESPDDEVEFLGQEQLQPRPSTSSAPGRTSPSTSQVPSQGSSGAAPKNGRKTSSVWAHYEASDDGSFATCKFCNAKVILHLH